MTSVGCMPRRLQHLPVKHRRGYSSLANPIQPVPAEVICVGSEILSGDITDTNSQFIGKNVSSLGIELVHTHHVSDSLEHVKECVRASLSRAPIVFLIGGLGPTVDDITREAVAGALKEELKVDSTLEHELREFFGMRRRSMTDNNLKQAAIIPSAKALRNSRGTAPGWVVRVAAEKALQWATTTSLSPSEYDRLLFVLPGPPAEMSLMYTERVLPLLKQEHIVATAPRVHVRVIKLIGPGESKVEAMLGDAMMATDQLSVGIYHKQDGIYLKLTAVDASMDTCRRLVQEREDKIMSVVGSAVWGFDDDTLAQSVASDLHGKGILVAVSEVLTGGQLCHELTGDTAFSSVLKGGEVLASNTDWELADDALVHAMSQNTAAAAKQVKQRYGTSWGVAVGDTVPLHRATTDVPAGLTYVSVVDGADNVRTEQYVYHQSHTANKNRALQHVYALMRELL